MAAGALMQVERLGGWGVGVGEFGVSSCDRSLHGSTVRSLRRLLSWSLEPSLTPRTQPRMDAGIAGTGKMSHLQNS